MRQRRDRLTRQIQSLEKASEKAQKEYGKTSKLNWKRRTGYRDIQGEIMLLSSTESSVQALSYDVVSDFLVTNSQDIWNH